MATPSRLFELLAEARAQPSGAFKDFSAAADAGNTIAGEAARYGMASKRATLLSKMMSDPNTSPQDKTAIGLAASEGQPLSDIYGKQQDARFKYLEMYGNLSKAVGPARANAIFKQNGLPIPDMSGGMGGTEANGTAGVAGMTSATVTPTSTPETPEQLMNEGEYGTDQLGRMGKVQDMADKGPRSPATLKSSIVTSGQMSPTEFDQWAAANTDPKTGMIPHKNFDDLTKSLGLKAQASRADYFAQKGGQITLSQLPSQMSQSTNAGAAAMVQMSARQGMSLIANPSTDPKRIGLAAGDMARTVLRAAPQLDAQKGANYSETLANKLNQLANNLSSGQIAPKDIPAVRKQMYDTFNDLKESAKPYIAQHLANVEDTLHGNLPPNWERIKAREMGDDIPSIPFQATTAPAQPSTPQSVPRVTGDPEADAAIATVNAAPISSAQKKARISAIKARASRR